MSTIEELLAEIPDQTLADQIRQEVDNLVDAAYEEGRSEVDEEDSYDQGFQDGKAEGFQDGFDQGYEEGCCYGNDE